MRRRVELNRAQYVASTLSNRNIENNTKDWCKIDEISREKSVKERLAKQREEDEELERRRHREALASERERAIQAERAKAAQLIEQRRKDTCDRKERLRLRENCQELRLLEAQLKTAYVAKENAYQIGEKRARELQEKIQAERERQAAEECRLAALKRDELKASERQREKEEFRRFLQDQMRETFQRKRVRYEEFLREKQWIDQITSMLQEEQVVEVEKKMRRIQEASDAIEEYRAYRDQCLKEQQQQTEEENRRIGVYLQEKEAFEQRQVMAKKSEREKKTAVVDKLSQHLDGIETEARKREELLVELNMKEIAEREEKRLRKNLEEQIRKRVQVRMELEKQREFQWIRQQQEKEEDRLFKEEQLRIMAETDRLEMMSQERRRRMQVEHRKAVEVLLEERKQKRVKELDEEKQRHSQEIKDAQRIREMIEEERIKILQEHAQELIGFLPPGILKLTDGQHLPLPNNKRLN